MQIKVATQNFVFYQGEFLPKKRSRIFCFKNSFEYSLIQEKKPCQSVHCSILLFYFFLSVSRGFHRRRFLFLAMNL